jgi:translation initiation factor 1
MRTNRDDNRTVYSTEQGRICPNCGKPLQNCDCKKKKNNLPIKRDGILRLRLERKGRGGKAVTLVEGLPFNEDLLKELSRDLKRHCGVGGAVKNGIIEIQGDVRDIAVTFLQDKGYRVKKAGG